MIDRWFNIEPGTVVLESGLEWQSTWPTALLVTALVLGWAAIGWMHRSDRLDLSPGWRIVLGALRFAVLLVPFLILFQPSLAARLEKQQPRSLVFLLDQSKSMSVADDADGNATRFERARTALGALSLADNVNQETFAFDEALRSAEATLANLDPDGSTTSIGAALSQLSAELAGNTTAGVVLISDGRDLDQGQSPLAATRDLARLEIPVHTVLVGDPTPKDVAVQAHLEAQYAFVGDPVALRAHIDHNGYDDEVVSVTLADDQRVIASNDVVLPGEGESTSVTFELRPESSGEKAYRVEVLPAAGELTAANNTAEVNLQVIEQPIRVLYVERWPRWQYQFLRNAMQRDHRFEVQFVLLTEDPTTPDAERQAGTFPQTREELGAFDVFIFGDLAPQDVGVQQWEMVRELVVDEGVGLILIAGSQHMPHSFSETPIADLLPFDRVGVGGGDEGQSFRPRPTPLGELHPIMRMGFADPAAVGDVCPELVGAERPAAAGAGDPLIIVQRSGRGSVLFVGTDETWRWRYEVGNRYFYGFWAHAIQHTGMRHRVGEFQNVNITLASQQIVPGQGVGVTVAFDEVLAQQTGDRPEDVVVRAEPLDATGQTTEATVRSLPDAPLVFTGELRFDEPGSYRISVVGYEDAGETRVDVSAAEAFDAELALPTVNAALLHKIAELTGGRHVALDALPTLVNEMDLSPLRYRWSQRIALWDGWGMLSLLAVLLTVEWVLRKWLYLP